MVANGDKLMRTNHPALVTVSFGRRLIAHAQVGSLHLGCGVFSSGVDLAYAAVLVYFIAIIILCHYYLITIN